ncbi:hypothetical protein ACLK1T_13695 [Escherichia coli]
MIALSLTVSCRYIWWRYTSTLNWDASGQPACGLIFCSSLKRTRASCWCSATSRKYGR